MAALTQARDPLLVQLLVDNGTSLNCEKTAARHPGILRGSHNLRLYPSTAAQRQGEELPAGPFTGPRQLCHASSQPFPQNRDVTRDAYRDVAEYSGQAGSRGLQGGR